MVSVEAEAVDNGFKKAVESANGVDGRADGVNGNSKVGIVAFGEIGACGNKACGFISIMDRFVVDLSWLGLDCTGSVSETAAEHAEVVRADSAAVDGLVAGAEAGFNISSWQNKNKKALN